MQVLWIGLLGCSPEPVVPIEPLPVPRPSPRWGTEATFWSAFVDTVCIDAAGCGDEVTLDAFGCPAGVEMPVCGEFDPVAAEDCLGQLWACDEGGLQLPDACTEACSAWGAPEPVTVPPEPTPPPASPSFTVVLRDGDQLFDIEGVVDADTLEVIVYDGVEDYSFGFAQTEVGPENGWFGEDCWTGAFCHPLGQNGVVLERVSTIGEVVEGWTTLLPVDYPESSTPGITWIVRGEVSGACWISGHDPAYYGSLGCDEL